MAFGDRLGTLTANAISITNPFDATGSVTVAVGDLVVAVCSEQIDNSATAASDNLGNTYSAVSAGTDAGNVCARAFYSRVTVAGTLTFVRFTATASNNNVVANAVAYQGPVSVGPLDQFPSDSTEGGTPTSPFTCPATGTLTQADELVVCWGSRSGTSSTIWSCTSPLLKDLEAFSVTVIANTIGSKVVSSTATTTPEFTGGTNPANCVLGTATFKKAAASETTSADKWYVAWQDPVRSKPGLRASAQSVLAFVKHTPFPETVTEDRWHQAWSEPVRVKPGPRTAAQDELAAPVTLVETVTVDKWFQHLGTPPKPKVSIAAASQQFAALVKADPFPETVQEDKWHQAWSEPVRTKPRLREASQQTLAFVKADPFPEIVTEDRWHQPWSEPVRVKVTLRTAAQTSTVVPFAVDSARTVSLLTVLGLEGYGVSRGGPYTGKTPATTNTWWGGPPLSEPARTTTRWTARAASGANLPVLDPNSFELRWHQPWSMPVRVKPGLAAHHQQFLAYSESQQFPETVQEDKWHRPWSDPSAFLTKRGLAAHQQRASTGVENVPANISWFAALSDPVRVKLRLCEASQQPLAFVKADPFPETVTEDRWHQPWSEPAAYLFKRGLAARYQQFSIRWDNDVPFNEVVTSDKWFAPLSLPVRVKIDPRRANALATSGPFYSESAQFPETVTESRWHQPWSEPIRHWARHLKPSQQQFAALGRPPVVSFSWFATLRDPVRVKTCLPAGEQQTLAFNPQPFVNYSWFEPFSEPVRHKLRFTEHPPPSYSQDDPPPPPPPPPPTGSGRRKDFPSYIPQPPYAAKKNPPFRPVWDERRRRAAQAILDEEKRRTAPAIPMPPAEIFQRPAPVSYPMPGQVDPAQSQLIAQQAQDARDIADVQDAMSALQSDRQDAQDAIDILSIL